MRVLDILPWYDWAALAWFIAMWAGYDWFARFWGARRPSLLLTTNRWRRYWMLQATSRDPRVLDGVITQSLSTSPSFFASTTIIIIGGLLALLGTTDKAADFVREIPFAARTSMLVFDLKVLVVLAVFVYAFFRFSWSMRQYTFAALVLGAMPHPDDFESAKFDRTHFADRAGTLLGLAAETFNDGVRAYYFAFAVIAWFFSPVAFAIAAALIVLILYSREFRSAVLHVLRE